MQRTIKAGVQTRRQQLHKPPESPLDTALHAFLADEVDDIHCWRVLVNHLRPPRVDQHAQATANLQTLIYQLARQAPLRDALARSLGRLLNTRKLVSLFASTGLLPSSGFFSEAARRLGGRLLPEARDPDSLKDALAGIFPRTSDHHWVSALPDALLAELLQLLIRPSPGENTEHPAAQQLAEAVRVLSYHISSLGLDPELLRISPELEQHESPFLAQNVELIAYLGRGQPPDGERTADERQVLVLLQQCHEVLSRIRRRSAKLGTSLSLTFKLERLEQLITRLEQLLPQLGHIAGNNWPQTALIAQVQLFKQLLQAECQRHSLAAHWRRNLGLLSLRVTENAGRKGEHYITTSRRELLALFLSAAGAGVIIALLAALKLIITRQGFAPLNEALLVCLNYGLGFVLIHMLHFTVATKQPAMTANAIAASLGEARGRTPQLDHLAALIVRTLRSQFAAILGNILVAVPIAIGLGWGLSELLQTPFLSGSKALSLLEETNPLATGALWYAALAGGCLFLAGLISGYYDNLCAYSRIPQRLRQLGWAKRVLGPNRLARISTYVEDNLGALAGNFFFGFLLGGVGTLGMLFGLPLDIRHIAFAAAQSGYALQALDFTLSTGQWLTTSAGVALIGCVNLAVSFSLALSVALRSRNVSFAQRRQLLGTLLRRLLHRPWELIIPPSATSAIPPEAPRTRTP